MPVVDQSFRHEVDAVASLAQAIGELDILVLDVTGVETALSHKDIPAKSSRVGGYEVCGIGARHALVAILELQLGETGRQGALVGAVGAHQPGRQARRGKAGQQRLNPAGRRLAVGVGEEQQRRPGDVGAAVAGSSRAAARLAQQRKADSRMPGSPTLHLVRRAIR